ncbi:MAG: 3-isopropylmalate dehydratase small subunit [Candidatus Dadabacteria bacterium]|nr:MAG: 3-isopropylmalate dehydratase small subunit [Candidatus Dadabacteria bacterium]
MTESTLQPVKTLTGRGVAVRGNDIDTDRIIPARFMKVVTFDGLEKHVFEDVRFDQDGNPTDHPFNREEYQGASILIVNKNFGCGSSREHAPQALMRWGIRGIIGESFAEIFFGNCVSLGVPCVTLPADQILYLMELVESDPSVGIEIDLEAPAVRVPARNQEWVAELPDGARKRFLKGTWDALAVLLDSGELIEATAQRIPYLNDFATAS